MICPVCNEDRHPTIQGGQGVNFVYVCANSSCNAVIGPVVRLATAAPPQSPAGGQQAHPAQPPPARPPSPVLPDARGTTAPSADYMATARERLAHLEASLPALIEERQTLRRMLRAADRRPRAAKSNVVSFPSKAAT